MTNAARKYPVSVYIREEMKARGWSTHELAAEMSDDVGKNECTLDLLLHVSDARMTLSRETAELLEGAFGADAETWLGIDESWREWKKGRIVDEYYDPAATKP